MKTLFNLALLLCLLIVGGAIAARSSLAKVGVGEVGVRINQYGVLGEQGIVPADYGPGWHRDLGPIDTWVIYDSTVQTIHEEDMPGGKLLITSADGYNVELDVSVKFRIRQGEAHLLYATYGVHQTPAAGYQKFVMDQAKFALQSVFGGIKTEEFYNPQTRREKATEIETLLAKALQPQHVDLIEVLVRDVYFDALYEEKIKSRALAEQDVLLKRSQQEAESALKHTEQIQIEMERELGLIEQRKQKQMKELQAETDLKIAEIEAQYRLEVQKTKADADLAAAKNEAQGIQRMKTAEAQGEKMRNDAMVGAGGEVLVALEAARNLQLKEIEVSTIESDFLDIDRMVEKLGLSARKR